LTLLAPIWHLHQIFTLLAPKQALVWSVTVWHNPTPHWGGCNEASGNTTSQSTFTTANGSPRWRAFAMLLPKTDTYPGHKPCFLTAVQL